MHKRLQLFLICALSLIGESILADDPCKGIDQFFDLQAEHQMALNRLGGCLASSQPVERHHWVVVAMMRHSMALDDMHGACRYAVILQDMLEGTVVDEPELAQALMEGLHHCHHK